MISLVKTWACSVVFWIAFLSTTGCASYRVSEQDIEDYLQNRGQTESRVGLSGIAEAKVSFRDIEVGIGRVSADRINVAAIADAALIFAGETQQRVQIDMNFSAVPFYDQHEGAIFLNNLQAEALRVTPDDLGVLNHRVLLDPIVEFIGQLLSTQALYRLDESDFKQSMVKKMKPQLHIRQHELVVDL